MNNYKEYRQLANKPQHTKVTLQDHTTCANNEVCKPYITGILESYIRCILQQQIGGGGKLSD